MKRKNTSQHFPAPDVQPGLNPLEELAREAGVDVAAYRAEIQRPVDARFYDGVNNVTLKDAKRGLPPEIQAMTTPEGLAQAREVARSLAAAVRQRPQSINGATTQDFHIVAPPSRDDKRV